MSIQVKIVENDDELQQVHQIRQTVFVLEQHCPPEEEFDQYEKEAVHFLVTNNDSPIGAGRFRTVNGDGKVERICIKKEARKTGAGKLLMEKIETYAKSLQLSKLRLNAQAQAIPFYQKLGYTICSEEFMEANIPHYSMEKSTNK